MVPTGNRRLFVLVSDFIKNIDKRDNRFIIGLKREAVNTEILEPKL